MPLYEYECKKCKRRVEKIQKFSDSPLTTCESCGGKLQRLLSSSAIQFKGSGWYVTDYAKKSSAPSSTSADDSSKCAKKKDTESTKSSEAPKPSEPAKASNSKGRDK